jgi:hypothetical protein
VQAKSEPGWDDLDYSEKSARIARIMKANA